MNLKLLEIHYSMEVLLIRTKWPNFGAHHKMKLLVALTCFLWMVGEPILAFKKNRLHLYAPESLQNIQLPPDRWFQQQLDHFEPTNNQTWMQRYGVNDSLAKISRNTPVFLRIGGEGEANPKWLVTGAWIDFAMKYGALCFQLEHRYYGKSRPTVDMSTQNLRYLSSEQALADLAYFIEGMNTKYKLTRSNKWIVFGGSYPGSLAAWMRYKYPHLVHAAISTSGPLLAIADFKEFNEVVKNSLATYSEDCVSSVKQATRYFDKLVQHPLGGQLLSKKFKLCNPLQVNEKLDIYNLASSLSDNFVGVVQYNKDNDHITSDPTWNVTIDDICQIMTNNAYGEPLDRYAAVNDMMMKLQLTKCLNHSYKDSIEDLKNVQWIDNQELAGRQWLYQTCTEFGFYQTSSSESELFGSNIPFRFYLQQCLDVFGSRFNTKLLNSGIKRTNTIYGGLHLTASRILFVHGSIDPWHALGITETRIPESPAIYISGAAHCANMYPPSPKDLPQLTKARLRIEEQIGNWLME